MNTQAYSQLEILFTRLQELLFKARGIHTLMNGCLTLCLSLIYWLPGASLFHKIPGIWKSVLILLLLPTYLAVSARLPSRLYARALMQMSGAYAVPRLNFGGSKTSPFQVKRSILAERIMFILAIIIGGFIVGLLYPQLLGLFFLGATEYMIIRRMSERGYTWGDGIWALITGGVVLWYWHLVWPLTLFPWKFLPPHSFHSKVAYGMFASAFLQFGYACYDRRVSLTFPISAAPRLTSLDAQKVERFIENTRAHGVEQGALFALIHLQESSADFIEMLMYGRITGLGKAALQSLQAKGLVTQQSRVVESRPIIVYTLPMHQMKRLLS